ncbi:hypothetical protein ACIQNU_03415 [Streptomyces sp. NPDC091292]|uniref:hypothetical protein n=1 Tax=Streptomyces sp. NPDC091292 TaxID=3365991 RepID=UPI00380C9E5D
MPARRTPPREPSLFAAIKWLILAACAALMLLGGINVVYRLLVGPSDTPAPVPTATATATETVTAPHETDIPGDATDHGPDSVPTPAVCTDADARGDIPRDRWTPCGQLLGYFDDWATPPPDSPVFP